MSRLVLCSACARHVRRSESACPFCGAAVLAPAPRALGPVLTRAALLVSGVAAGAVSVTGCVDDGQDEARRDDDAPTPTEPEVAASMAVPAYGVCIDDAFVRAPNCRPIKPIDGGTVVTPPAGDASVDGGTSEVDAGVRAFPPRKPPKPPKHDDGIRVQPAYGVSLSRSED